MNAWKNLAAREQKLVAAMLLVVAGSLLYLLLIEPLQQAYQRAESRVARAEQTLTQVHDAANRLQSLGGVQALPVQSSGSLFGDIDLLVRSGGLRSAVRSIKPANAGPNGEQQITLELNPVAFDLLISELGGTLERSGARLVSMNLRSDAEPGNVVGSVDLQRAQPEG